MVRKSALGLACGLAVIGVLGSSQRAHAAITVDGTLDSDYGAALAIGQTPTSFGDSTDGNSLFASGSEIDATYATVENGNLYVFLAGNLGGNGQGRVQLFVQTGAGGTNVLQPLTAGNSGTANYNRMSNAALGGGRGLTFDSGFAPNFYFTTVEFGGDPTTTDAGAPQIYTDDAILNTHTGGNGTAANPNGANFFNPTSTFPGLMATYNNSNTGGVTATTADPAAAAAVTTGIEYVIPLSSITVDPNTPITSIELAAFITGNDPNTVSNQVTGLQPGYTDLNGNVGTTTSLGDPVYATGTNFNNDAGLQYVTLNLSPVPEPASLSLLGLGGIALLRRRVAR